MPQDQWPRRLKAIGTWPVLCLSIAAASAVWVVGMKTLFVSWHGMPNTALTTFFLLAAAVSAKTSVSPRYRWGIVAGLAFSMLGDAFLMHPGGFFLHGLSSFLAAHICYLFAMTSDSRFAGRKWPFLLWGTLGIGLMFWLLPSVPKPMRIPVILYTAAILVMASQAASRACFNPVLPALLAAVGATLFVFSDAALAIQKFHGPLEWGRVLVLGPYFIAQGCITLSAILPGNAT